MLAVEMEEFALILCSNHSQFKLMIQFSDGSGPKPGPGPALCHQPLSIAETREPRLSAVSQAKFILWAAQNCW